eukprot:9470567-Lingulodinium_polyedra.AAC.1
MTRSLGPLARPVQPVALNDHDLNERDRLLRMLTRRPSRDGLAEDGEPRWNGDLVNAMLWL